MPPGDGLTLGIIFTAMTSAIAGLFGFAVWMVKAQIARGDACCAKKDELYAESQSLLKAVQDKNNAELERLRVQKWSGP